MLEQTSKELVVAESVYSWLPITESWIFNQISHIRNLKTIILTYLLMNLETYPHNSIYTASYIERLFYRGVRRYYLPIRHQPFKYRRAVKALQPKVLHSHFADQGWYDLPLVHRYQLNQVVNFYGYDVTLLPKKFPVWNKRYLELFESASAILCEGPFMANVISQMGCPGTKIHIQRLGVDLSNIPYQPRIFHHGDTFKIMIASAFREKKGIPLALEAVAALLPHYPNVSVTIIGDASKEKHSIKEKEKILSIIAKYKLDKYVRMLGYQPYRILMEEAYKHHVFLSPSLTASDGDTEGGAPVVLIDMAASGILIISTVHCDIPQIIKHGETGWLADECNPVQLTEYLLWYINNPHDWSRMAQAGRTHIENFFDVEKLAPALAQVYMQLAA